MVNRCSKSLHFGRKSWSEFEKPTPEVPILGTVCHLDSICGVFQHTLQYFNVFTTLKLQDFILNVHLWGLVDHGVCVQANRTPTKMLVSYLPLQPKVLLVTQGFHPTFLQALPQ